jgi:hypothetical protein
MMAVTLIAGLILLLTVLGLPAFAIGAASWTAAYMARAPYQSAWQSAARLANWLPAAGAVAAMAIFGARGFDPEDQRRLVELIVPLALAISAAFALAPASEPLELLLACPRPAWWLLAERLLLLVVPFALIAMAGALLLGDAILTVRWISPALLLSGIAVYVTQRTRLAVFGALLTIVIWVVMVFLGDVLLPGIPVMEPLHLVHPFLWLFHPYLTPEQVDPAAYLANRIAVGSLGVALLAMAMQQTRNSASMLGIN